MKIYKQNFWVLTCIECKTDIGYTNMIDDRTDTLLCVKCFKNAKQKENIN